MCQKNRKKEGGCSNTQHGDHDDTGINNRSEHRIETINTVHKEATGDITSNNNKNSIWARNILSTPLTEAQEKILLQGPNFAMVPKSPPVGEYIASIEHACSQLKQGRQKN